MFKLVKGFVNFHTVVTIAQLTIIILSLCVSTLGIVIEHPFVIYFWYLSLFAMAMMLLTSFLIGLVLLSTRYFMLQPLAEGQRWFTRPNSIQV
jgi:hypothetical protein